MSLDIIIATKDRPTDLHRTLDSVFIQTILPDKIIIVDSGTLFIDIPLFQVRCTEKNIQFRHIPSKPGLTHQRNVGIGDIESDLVIFLDDDVVLEPDYLEKMLQVFEEDLSKKIGGATGLITNNEYKPGFFSKKLRQLFFLERPSKGEILPSGAACSIDPEIREKIEIQWLSGCNMMYRKEVFADNLFDEHLTKYCYCEDVDFSQRVGKKWKLIFEPKARLQHLASPVNRLNDRNRYKMFMINHHYLFKKNRPQNIQTRFTHFLSMNGVMIQSLVFQKSIPGFVGSVEGMFQAIFKRPK